MREFILGFLNMKFQEWVFFWIGVGLKYFIGDFNLYFLLSRGKNG